MNASKLKLLSNLTLLIVSIISTSFVQAGYKAFKCDSEVQCKSKIDTALDRACTNTGVKDSSHIVIPRKLYASVTVEWTCNAPIAKSKVPKRVTASSCMGHTEVHHAWVALADAQHVRARYENLRNRECEHFGNGSNRCENANTLLHAKRIDVDAAGVHANEMERNKCS